jgi:hypothetical protein
MHARLQALEEHSLLEGSLGAIDNSKHIIFEASTLSGGSQPWWADVGGFGQTKDTAS